MSTLKKEDIDEQYINEITTEKYGRQPIIEGVKLIDIPHFTTEDGYFMELGRFDENTLNFFKEQHFKVRQFNLAQSAPLAVKAWHLHYNQEDVWFIFPESKALVGLVDLRKNSPTNKFKMRFVMGGGKSQLLYIPRGVAHGYVSIGENPLHIIYMVNNQFDAHNPDEQRLPWDHFGADFWEIHQG